MNFAGDYARQLSWLHAFRKGARYAQLRRSVAAYLSGDRDRVYLEALLAREQARLADCRHALIVERQRAAQAKQQIPRLITERDALHLEVERLRTLVAEVQRGQGSTKE